MSQAITRMWQRKKQLSARERQSALMKKHWRERPWSTRKKKVGKVWSEQDATQLAHSLQQDASNDSDFPHENGVLPERFPFREYGEVVREARKIVLDRDSKGRNAYATFYEGFPHGLSDATFETHRRVTRVLGIEKQLANGFENFEDRKPLHEVMRADLVDLVNYAVFAVLLLDKQAQE